ncbi:MAG: amino acid ABC transporter substrate-binding protein [Cyanobacteria bacterium P01_G01_bin.19]
MSAWITIKQKFSPLLLALALIAVVSGCGNSANNAGGSNGEAEPQSDGNSQLTTVSNRGSLVCGVNGQLPGFSFVDENGEYSGMDVDICRAVAAALFDDPTKVEYRDLSAQERFTAVQSGEVDMLSRNTTWTLSRDTSVGMEFAPTTFYDGQGLLTSRQGGIQQLEDLNNKSVCVLSGTTNEQNLADRMRKLGLSYSPVVFEDVDLLYGAYEQGRCEVATSDRSQLTARRAVLAQPDEHQVLDVVLSKEPLGPLVANGDSQWFDVVKWVTYATIQAEELGINSQNIDSFAQTEDPEIGRFLGTEGNLGEDMGLPNDFARRIVQHVGNYGEIYERNIGQPFQLERGLNALWSDGGLMYAPPFR